MPKFAANLTTMFNDVAFPQSSDGLLPRADRRRRHRHEPDDGEVNYRYLFRLLDELGYAGWVGCEYRPRGSTEDGLGWMKTLV